jgi:PAS domain S-box-containing protein
VLDAGGTVLVEQMEGALPPWPGTLAFSPALLGPVVADLLGLPPRQAPVRSELDQAAGILERMGDAYSVLDGKFVIRSVNAAAERLLGLPREQLVGRSHWAAFPASEDAPIGQALRRVVAEGTEQHLRHHYTGDGYDLHLEVDAYPTDAGGVAMFWRDVTERIRTQHALRESEDRRLLGLEAAGIGDWTYDVATGVLDCSPQARAMHGVGPDEPVTVHLHDRLIHPEDRAAVQAARARALDAATEYRVEFRFHPVGSETRWIESVGRAVVEATSEGPRATHLIGAMVDVTERKQREAHQAFLLDLTEALSVLSDEAAIVQAAGARLAAHLHLSGYHYVDVDEPRAEVTVRHVWHALDVPPLLGTYPIAGFISPEGLVRLRAGEPNVMHDVLAEVPGDTVAGQGLKAGAAAQKIRAYVAVPFSQDRQWNGYFAVADSEAVDDR